MLKREMQNQLDLILFEEGCFSPLTWLLRAGHLEYADYQRWRNSEVDYLEKCFKSSKDAILSDLKQAQDYAKILKLEGDQHLYTSVSNRALHFSRCADSELIYTTIYAPAKERIQRDLFFDSSPVSTAHDLICAIANQNNAEITRLLSKLKSLDCDKQQQFEHLLEMRDELEVSALSNSWKIQFLEENISPLAYFLLGSFAHDFLIPLWQQLSAVLADQPFAAYAPENHLSYTAFKGFQWQEVLSSIAREEQWHTQPLLLYRFAEASFKLNKEWQGLDLWFRLFMFFADKAEQLISKTGNQLLFSDWQFFQELDPVLDTEFFPAWVLLQKPALSKQTLEFAQMCPGLESFQLISKLVSCKGDGVNQSAVLSREELKQHNPQLFIHLMRTMQSEGNTAYLRRTID